MKYQIITVFLWITSYSAMAQPPANMTPPDLRSKNSNPAQNKNLPLSFDLSMGTASYPILELPLAKDSDVRVDGSADKEDLRLNSGALMALRFTWNSPTSYLPFYISAGGQRAASAPGSGIPSPSSYLRLSSDVSTELTLAGAVLSILPGLEARRSMYRNVDSGHYVDAILVKTQVNGHVTSTLDLSVSGGTAPYTRFGVLRNSDSGRSGALASTSASVTETAAKVTWTPEPSTSFHAGLSQESTIAHVKNTSGYRAYGLPVAPSESTDSGRVYNLTVRQLLIGTTKKF